MKLFQRIFSLLLIGCLVFSFAACGKKTDGAAADGTTGATQGPEGTEGTTGADATQPTNGSADATQPGDGSADETQPGNSTNPTQPANPGNPSTPSTPSTPSQPTNPPVPSTPAKAPDSLILNADGSYGGTLNKALYGEGGLWVRPASMWNETVERDGKVFKRFEYIGE